MKNTSLNSMVKLLRICIIGFILALVSLFIFSFTTNKINEEFLKQLGISKTEADKKITGSILGGYLNTYGAKNAVNLAAGNRVAVAKDLLAYTKQYTNSDYFKKEYATLKESNRPKENKVQTPEEFRKEAIDTYKKSITDVEGYLKKATADTKPTFEKLLADNKKLLKDAEDPNNKQVANYTKSYPEIAKSNQQSYTQALQQWEAKYPTNQMLFVKQRLQQFLEETKDIDFSAELTIKGNKKIFLDAKYEKQKGHYWKMAFRAGKDVVEASREFVQNWIQEIK